MKVNLLKHRSGRLRAAHQSDQHGFDTQDITGWFKEEPVVMPEVISLGGRVAIRGDLLGYTPELMETDYYLASVGSVFPTK